MAGQSTEWLETMLGFAANLLSQVTDAEPEACGRDTTGPERAPDMYDVRSLLGAIREKCPNY